MSEKTLVLMPGLDGTGRLFEPVIPLLEQQFRLTVVTYPNLNSFNDYINCARSHPRACRFGGLSAGADGATG